MKPKITCLNVDCPERFSLCCKEGCTNGDEGIGESRFVCKGCRHEFIGGKCKNSNISPPKEYKCECGETVGANGEHICEGDFDKFIKASASRSKSVGGIFEEVEIVLDRFDTSCENDICTLINKAYSLGREEGRKVERDNSIVECDEIYENARIKALKEVLEGLPKEDILEVEGIRLVREIKQLITKLIEKEGNKEIK